jgi:hypothetical protein
VSDLRKLSPQFPTGLRHSFRRFDNSSPRNDVLFISPLLFLDFCIVPGPLEADNVVRAVFVADCQDHGFVPLGVIPMKCADACDCVTIVCVVTRSPGACWYCHSRLTEFGQLTDPSIFVFQLSRADHWTL